MDELSYAFEFQIMIVNWRLCFLVSKDIVENVLLLISLDIVLIAAFILTLKFAAKF